jgi:hypothetical protein
LYRCEICPLTLTEENKLTVLENRILRRLFGPKNTQKGWKSNFRIDVKKTEWEFVEYIHLSQERDQ